MAYCIVKFIEENDAPGVVCSSWMNGDETRCLYPNVRTDEARDKLLRRQAMPNTNWISCAVKVLRKYDAYNDARGNLIRAEETSNLESEEETSTKTRKRKRSAYFPDSDEEICSRKDSRVLDDYPLPPLQSPVPSPVSQSTSQKAQPTTSSHQGFLQIAPCSQTPSYQGFSQIAPCSQTPSLQVFEPSSSNQRQHVINARILAWMAEMSTTVNRLEKKMDFLLGMQHPVPAQAEQDMTMLESLPVENSIQFAELEAKLLADEKFRSSLTKMLVSLGGKDFRFLGFNMLRRMLSDSFAETFSMSGKVMKTVQKKSFVATNLWRIIFEGCKKVYSDVTEEQMRIVVGDWLHQAKFRRLRRLEKVQKIIENV